jgi:hypothetical protein
VEVAESQGVDIEGVRLDSGDLVALSKEVADVVRLGPDRSPREREVAPRFLDDDPPVGLRMPAFDVALEGLARRKVLAAEVAATVTVWCQDSSYVGLDAISFAAVAVWRFARRRNRDASLSASSPYSLL